MPPDVDQPGGGAIVVQYGSGTRSYGGTGTPPTQPPDGTTWQLRDTWIKQDEPNAGQVYEYTGSGEYNGLMPTINIKGPRGERGQSGVDGEAGPKGNQGNQGQKGEDGERGESGVDGSDGEKGDQGDSGENGVDGQTGSRGSIFIGKVANQAALPAIDGASVRIGDFAYVIDSGELWRAE